ncbi:MaoC family dehydratase [Actinokineospora guangxiensis]|uniref:MaoC family dehydratase n=1 Tax=Actinokineospora guangxiensis TaxID=1490288 RepID=A0ABW0EDY1_9PSEU
MAVVDLGESPSLGLLYPKAAVAGLTKRGGDELPERVYQWRGVRVDPAHLAAYDRVCGFRLADELPATYPHVLTFPMQVKLMTDADFPFPLIGSVHLRNRISQSRALRVDEEFDLRVHVENLRPHAKGRQFDMVSQAFAAGEAVWHDTSTYLVRGGGSGASSAGSGSAPGAPSAVWRVPEDIGRRYGEVSGDRNPIHLHPLSARLFGFRRAIAHGMWTKARCLAAYEGRLPEAHTVDVRFKLPVLLPAKVAFSSVRVEDGYRFGLVDVRKGKPHLEGVITV